MTREILQITGGSLQRTSVLEASDSAAEENVGRVRKGVGIGGGSAWGVMEWRRCARGQGEPPLLLPRHFFRTGTGEGKLLWETNLFLPFSSSFLIKSQEDSFGIPFP